MYSLSKAKWFTKLDMWQGYNQIRMAAGEKWKTVFRTNYRQLEYTVMSVRLTNGTATFQHFINNCLRVYRDLYCSTYLNDILIHNDNMNDHRIHVRQVLETLRKNIVFLNPKKCEFQTQFTKYLSLIISPDGISIDPVKVEAVQEWKSPKIVKDV